MIKKFTSLLVLLLTGIQLFAQITITGKVVDEEGYEIPGVNIYIKGTTIGTISDLDGKYTIEVPDEDAILVFSSIGYEKKEISVAGKTSIDVQMEVETKELEDVVVIGYGTVKKDDLTGAVSVVTEEDINRTPASTIGKAIQGKASGVLVTQSGSPGGDYNLRVRGIGSLNRDPDPLYVIDGIVGADINTIAPQDIASLQVLKDASSTAIYGADGANGVVIITTKRGKPGKTKVSFSSYYSINTIPKQFNMMNADEYVDFYNEVYISNNEEPQISYSDGFRQAYYGDGWQEGTNWQDEIIQDAYTQNYYLRVSGGGENSNFSLSSRYYNEKGLLVNSSAESFSLRANSDFQIGKYIKVGESLNLSRRVYQNANTEAFYWALESSPLMKVYNEDNKEGYEGSQIPYTLEIEPDSTVTALNTGGNDKFNPLGMIAIPEDYDYRSNVIATAYVEIQPVEWLTIRSEPAFGGNFDRDNIWTPRYEMGVRGTNAATLKNAFSEGLSFSIKNQLTFNKTFNKHNLNVIAVHHGRKGWSNDSDVDAIGFNYEQLNVITQGNEIVAQGGYWPWGRLSYLGRLLYDFDSRYLLTASIRRDGTSNFGEDRRWGNFPSFSAAWKLNEDLFPTFEPVTMMKLRAGWGKTGNSDIGSFQYMTPLGAPIDFHPVIGNQVVEGLNEFTQIGNPKIKWEAADMTNVGVDLNAYNGKIQFSAEYFIKKQNDLLVKIPISGSMGRVSGEPWYNLGKIENRGYEFDLRYSEREGELTYDITANFSRVRNEVVELPETILKDRHITKEGHTIGSLYGYVDEGLVQPEDFTYVTENEDGTKTFEGYRYAIPSEGVPYPGDIRFKDLNRDGKITDADRTIIGKAVPDFNYTFNINVYYKNFDFSLFLFGMQNMQVYNWQRSWIEGFAVQDLDHNKSADFAANYYTLENPTDEYIRADINNTNDNIRISTWWIEDASFMRIQDVQLGYSVPPTYLNYLGLSNARIYLSVKNLYTLTGYKGRDPEAPINTANDVQDAVLAPGVDETAYPLPRVFTAGLKLDF